MSKSTPSEMVSLYDYYGVAQGPVVGRKVYNMAVEDRVSMGSKMVENYKYTGKIMMYPRTWLDKLDFIDKVYEDGAKSDKELVEMIKQRACETPEKCSPECC